MNKQETAPNDYREAPIGWFRNMAPYIKAHRGSTFVISFPGEAALEGCLTALAQDVALLNSLGVRLILVYGCRPQIEAQLEAAGLNAPLHHGQRITDAASMPAVQAAVGAQRVELEAALSMGLPNSPMQGARLRVCGGNYVTAQPRGIVDGMDYQLTGRVRRIDSAAIERQLAEGSVVLLSPLGFSPTGEVFNLSREDVAISAARAVNADKLILLGPTAGLHAADGKLLRQCVAGELDAGTLADSDEAQLLHTAHRACEARIPRCHLVSYRDPDALLGELFTTDGSGTLVSSAPYEQSRWAGIDDVGGVIDLIAPLEASGVLLKRSRELLEAEIGRFRILERDGRIVACAALYPFAAQGSAELACIVSHPEYRGERRAQRLLDELEQEARVQGLREVFVLTTQTAHWFLEQGFAESELDALPPQRQALYNLQRNSKVFSKTLSESA